MSRESRHVGVLEHAFWSSPNAEEKKNEVLLLAKWFVGGVGAGFLHDAGLDRWVGLARQTTK